VLALPAPVGALPVAEAMSYTQGLTLKAFTRWYWELLCLLVYLALTASQLFTEPITGLADNGDFPKVLAPQGVCVSPSDTFAYIYSSYAISPECYWDSRLPSSEGVFVRIIKQFAQWGGRKTFRVTGAGKAHLTVVAGALMVLLWGLKVASPPLRFAIPVLVILIFSDVAYVSYLNSFYMDAASSVFLLMTVALAAAWQWRPRAWVPIAFGVAGVLFGFSKTQHAITAFFLAALAAWFAVQAFRQGEKGGGWCWVTSSAVLAASAAGIIMMTPPDYKAEPLYSLIFYRILPGLSHPADALSELGLPIADLALSGTYAYSEGAPVMKDAWRQDFIDRVTYRRLATYYLRNPGTTLHLIWRGLREEVPQIRPPNIGNYQRIDGFPPFSAAHRFDCWSRLRSRALQVVPALTPIFYGVTGGGALLCIFLRKWAGRWPHYPLALALAASGVVEFLFAVLLDGTETARHLFLFQTITEILIVLAMSAGLSRVRASEAGRR
jgi:hypothetical protein